ncbi:hypothetical protein J3R04_004460 [Spirilliplanes yamanashiensis]|nr:hypothetical protein [Spirilliplanes yamanashiensis]
MEERIVSDPPDGRHGASTVRARRRPPMSAICRRPSADLSDIAASPVSSRRDGARAPEPAAGGVQWRAQEGLRLSGTPTPSCHRRLRGGRAIGPSASERPYARSACTRRRSARALLPHPDRQLCAGAGGLIGFHLGGVVGVHRSCGAERRTGTDDHSHCHPAVLGLLGVRGAVALCTGQGRSCGRIRRSADQSAHLLGGLLGRGG